jgi:cell surface protein SprA
MLSIWIYSRHFLLLTGNCNYNGLSKIGNLSKIFSSVQISHGYKTYPDRQLLTTPICSFEPTNPYQIDELNFNYIARYEIPQVVIREDLQPLFGLDVKMKNEMTFKADFKKSRSLAMSFIDYQLAESRSTSYSAGFGYRMKNVNIPFLTGKKKRRPRRSNEKTGSKCPSDARLYRGSGGTQANDLNIKFDFEGARRYHHQPPARQPESGRANPWCPHHQH